MGASTGKTSNNFGNANAMAMSANAAVQVLRWLRSFGQAPGLDKLRPGGEVDAPDVVSWSMV
jgi:hypothetical protein